MIKSMELERFVLHGQNHEHCFPITLEKATQMFMVARTSEKMVLDSLPYALRAMLIASPEFRETKQKIDENAAQWAWIAFQIAYWEVKYA